MPEHSTSINRLFPGQKFMIGQRLLLETLPCMQLTGRTYIHSYLYSNLKSPNVRNGTRTLTCVNKTVVHEADQSYLRWSRNYTFTGREVMLNKLVVLVSSPWRCGRQYLSMRMVRKVNPRVFPITQLTGYVFVPMVTALQWAGITDGVVDEHGPCTL